MAYVSVNPPTARSHQLDRQRLSRLEPRSAPAIRSFSHAAPPRRSAIALASAITESCLVNSARSASSLCPSVAPFPLGGAETRFLRMNVLRMTEAREIDS